MKNYRYIILVAICIAPIVSFAQVKTYVDFKVSIAKRPASAVGLGLEQNLGNSFLAMGLTYNEIGFYDYGPDFAVDGGTNSRGLGFTFSYNKFFTKEKGLGLFYGWRGEMQVLSDNSVSFLSFPSNQFNNSSQAYIVCGRLGLMSREVRFTQWQIFTELGYTYNPDTYKHLMLNFGMQISFGKN